jgi:hypothetical protein
VEGNGIGVTSVWKVKKTASVGKSGKKEQQRAVGGAKWRASSPFSVGKNGGAEWGKPFFDPIREGVNIFVLFIQNSLYEFDKHRVYDGKL